MHRNVDPELLSRPQVERIRKRTRPPDLSVHHRFNITQHPLDTRSIPAATMTDRILGREAFTESERQLRDRHRNV